MNAIISDTTFDRISQFYFSDEMVLAPEDEAIRIRWSTCFMQLNDELNTDRDVSVFMVKQFGISEGQAYKDIRNCRRLFGDVRTYTKEAMRYHVTQWAIELLKMCRAIRLPNRSRCTGSPTDKSRMTIFPFNRCW